MGVKGEGHKDDHNVPDTTVRHHITQLGLSFELFQNDLG